MSMYQKGYRPQTSRKLNRRASTKVIVFSAILCLVVIIASVACIVARMRTQSVAENALNEKIASITPFNVQVSKRESSQFNFSPYSYVLRFNVVLSESGYSVDHLNPNTLDGRDSIFGWYNISDSVKLYILTDGENVSSIMVRANDDSDMDIFRMTSILAIRALGHGTTMSEAERLYSEIYTNDVPSERSAKCEHDIYYSYVCKDNGYREVIISK